MTQSEKLPIVRKETKLEKESTLQSLCDTSASEADPGNFQDVVEDNPADITPISSESLKSDEKMYSSDDKESDNSDEDSDDDSTDESDDEKDENSNDEADEKYTSSNFSNASSYSINSIDSLGYYMYGKHRDPILDKLYKSCRNETFIVREDDDHMTSDQEDSLSSTSQSSDAGESNSWYKQEYEEVKELGSGGFGVVMKVERRDEVDKNEYAVKIVGFSEDPSKDDSKVSEVLREVNLLSNLQHENIVRYYYAKKEAIRKVDKELKNRIEEIREEAYGSSSAKRKPLKGVIYIVMEYCPETLENRMKSEEFQYMSKYEIWKILDGIASGLQHMHSQEIIHRDLKPGNILISKDGLVKIADFGLARRIAQAVEENEMSPNKETTSHPEELTAGVGTVLYCAPETLIEGTNYDDRVDMYSLGIIIFEICMRRNGLFKTDSERISDILELRKTKKVPTKFPHDWEEFAKVIEVLLQNDPQQRPTCKDLLEMHISPYINKPEWEKLCRIDRSGIPQINERLNFKKEKFLNNCKDFFEKSNTLALGIGEMGSLIPYSIDSENLEKEYCDKFSRLTSSNHKPYYIPYDTHTYFARHILVHPYEFRNARRYSFDLIFNEANDSYKHLMTFNIIGDPFASSIDDAFQKMSFSQNSDMNPSLACSSDSFREIHPFSHEELQITSPAPIFQNCDTKYLEEKRRNQMCEMEVEAIRVCSEIVALINKHANEQQDVIVRIGHTQVFNEICGYLGLSNDSIPDFIRILKNARVQGKNTVDFGDTRDLKLSNEQSNRLITTLRAIFNVCNINALKQVFPQSDGIAGAALEIEMLFQLLGDLQIGNMKIIFDPLYSHKLFRRYSGINFRIEIHAIQTPSEIRKFETIGYGGRYDSLVKKHSALALTAIDFPVAGVCFHVDRIVKRIVSTG